MGVRVRPDARVMSEVGRLSLGHAVGWWKVGRLEVSARGVAQSMCASEGYVDDGPSWSTSGRALQRVQTTLRTNERTPVLKDNT